MQTLCLLPLALVGGDGAAYVNLILGRGKRRQLIKSVGNWVILVTLNCGYLYHNDVWIFFSDKRTLLIGNVYSILESDDSPLILGGALEFRLYIDPSARVGGINSLSF